MLKIAAAYCSKCSEAIKHHPSTILRSRLESYSRLDQHHANSIRLNRRVGGHFDLFAVTPKEDIGQDLLLLQCNNHDSFKFQAVSLD
jgi:hypothetical protein